MLTQTRSTVQDLSLFKPFQKSMVISRGSHCTLLRVPLTLLCKSKSPNKRILSVRRIGGIFKVSTITKFKQSIETETGEGYSREFKITRDIFPLLRPHIFKIITAWICAAISVGSLTIFVQRIGELSASLANGDVNALSKKSIAVLVLVASRSLAQFWQDSLLWEVATSVTLAVRNNMFLKIGSLDMSYFEGRKNAVELGDMAFRLTQEAESLGDGIFAGLHALVPSLLQLAAMVFRMIQLSSLLTMSTLFVVPLMSVVISILGEKVRSASLRGQKAMASLTGYANEILPSMTVVKVHCAESYEGLRFCHLAVSEREGRLRKKKLKALFPHAITAAYSGALLSLFGVATWSISRGELSPSRLISFLTSLVLLVEPLQEVGSSVNEIKQSQGAIERVLEVTSWEPKVKEKENAVELREVVGEIMMEKVSFQYAEGGEEVLGSISLHVRPGETVAVVGPSGSGKSSILKLLLRLYDPTAGSIMVDGVDIREVSLSSLRKHMAIVPQDCALLSGTIVENIAYGFLPEEVDMAAVRESARQANALDFIEMLPQGFLSSVGERGVALSGGQRQRITIARAFYRNPSILLLDEATSALDNKSETSVREALEHFIQQKTAVIIAHRPETISLADRIIFLENGVILEEGTQVELAAKNGPFAKMYKNIL